LCRYPFGVDYTYVAGLRAFLFPHVGQIHEFALYRGLNNKKDLWCPFAIQKNLSLVSFGGSKKTAAPPKGYRRL
jgi:hypothetical protein